MATSKCGACNARTFELMTIEPRSSAMKYNAIQCSACGAVAGVVEYIAIGDAVNKILTVAHRVEAKADDLAARIARIEAVITRSG